MRSEEVARVFMLETINIQDGEAATSLSSRARHRDFISRMLVN